jgi:hypothetical protein
MVSPRRKFPSRDVAPTTADVDSGELTPAQPPQLVRMHNASDSHEVRSCSRDPPRGDQYLGRSEDAHHDSMGTYAAR